MLKQDAEEWAKCEQDWKRMSNGEKEIKQIRPFRVTKIQNCTENYNFDILVLWCRVYTKTLCNSGGIFIVMRVSLRRFNKLSAKLYSLYVFCIEWKCKAVTHNSNTSKDKKTQLNSNADANTNTWEHCKIKKSFERMYLNKYHANVIVAHLALVFCLSICGNLAFDWLNQSRCTNTTINQFLCKLQRKIGALCILGINYCLTHYFSACIVFRNVFDVLCNLYVHCFSSFQCCNMQMYCFN